MERLIRSDEQLVSLLCSHRSNVLSRPPFAGNLMTSTLGRLDLIRVFQAPHTKAQPWVATLLTITRKKRLTTLM